MQSKEVADLIREAFRGVKLGNGVGLMQGQGLDDYASEAKLAEYRAGDEKEDWSKIPTRELKRYYSSLSFFDAEGMRFHLPAFMIAELEGQGSAADVMFHLTLDDKTLEQFFGLLSNEQRQAIRAYLLHQKEMLDPPGLEFEGPGIDQALNGYWAESNDR